MILTRSNEICAAKLGEELGCTTVSNGDFSSLKYVGFEDGDWHFYPCELLIVLIDVSCSSFTFSDTYEPLAETCQQFYQLGIVPNQGDCLEFQTKSSEVINCCWNNIDPSGAEVMIAKSQSFFTLNFYFRLAQMKISSFGKESVTSLLQ